MYTSSGIVLKWQVGNGLDPVFPHWKGLVNILDFKSFSEAVPFDSQKDDSWTCRTCIDKSYVSWWGLQWGDRGSEIDLSSSPIMRAASTEFCPFSKTTFQTTWLHTGPTTQGIISSGDKELSRGGEPRNSLLLIDHLIQVTLCSSHVDKCSPGSSTAPFIGLRTTCASSKLIWGSSCKHYGNWPQLSSPLEAFAEKLSIGIGQFASQN